MFVAEAVVSSFLGVLIDKLIASPLLEYARRKKVDTTLQEWRRTLTHIEAVLDDAENKQIREKAVEVWLDDLKSLAYDIEDVVDEFDTEAKQRSLTEGHQASTCKVRKLIPTFGALDPRAMSFNKKMGEKINKITRELDAIAKRRLDFHLREGVGGVSFGIEERLPTTSLVDESRIHGRDADKEKNIELMLSDEATQLDKVSVISIVGMGGIGKTTLAQIIYKDGRVENRFEKRVWQAFKNLNSNACQNLESIGWKIAKKCKGLPLAVKTLAGLLRSKQDSTAWNEVLNNDVWDLPNEQNNILPALNLSYCYLPTTLKRCFAYCSIFPKDYVFDKEKLVLLWMAEGFLDGSKRGEAIEEFGSICFDNLLSRCLRVLSLTYSDIKEVPHSIENLKHLRYLDLSHTPIGTLPESITTLFNLQTLMLSECRYLVDLPTKMGRLINLRHLKINGTNLERMPIEMSRMKNLRTLTTFVVGKHTGSRVGELRDLSHLSGTLAIFKLQNVADARDALESNMKGKECLDKLELNWEDDNAIVGDSHDAASVLEKLQPHSNLKELSIRCYYGAKFPSWLGEPSFINMVRLQLSNCKNCASLPPLGQLRSLQNLSIVKNDVLQKTLVFKEISVWEEWDCFGVEGGEFPRLNELRIEYCPKLKGDLPKHLPVLTSLVILECGQLVCQLPEAPSIQKLNLKECDEVVLRSVVHLPSITELESLSSLPEMGLPPMLETLRIEKCHILETLPEGMTQNNTSLQSLYIDCDSLTSLPIISSLKSLEIMQCGKVELPLPEETTHNYYPWLTYLLINRSCDSLTSFPLAFFTKLETLNIWGCTNLESLYIPDGVRNMDLTSLQNIHIWDCPTLVSFPQGGLPASNLRSLWIRNCMKLKSLPQRMHTLLTSLDDLWIRDCPEIVSFPEGGLPTNLSSLEIWNCYKLMESRKEWGLQTLPSLRYLTIRGDLKSLDNLGLQNLTSLEALRIVDCVKLKSFPKQGLPSLSVLEIHKCPLLKKQCLRDKGKEWRNIAHIPR
ncbi:putative disease resistance protein RGA4 [Vitis vinifera]|uniref:Putative disease resistance protein RGA4 n=1 Tax=Vitis vinifera TaxID=29760 RepID=A0A438HK17_VITVI|nr:putative disease resistance protein RGA4 [Vitis vinifera]